MYFLKKIKLIFVVNFLNFYFASFLFALRLSKLSLVFLNISMKICWINNAKKKKMCCKGQKCVGICV